MRILLLLLLAIAPNAWAQGGFELPDGTMLPGVDMINGALPQGSLTILGLTLDRSSFTYVKQILGPAANLPRIDDPHEPDTICYAADSDPKVRLSFNAGWPESPTEKLTSFTLASGDLPRRKGQCALSAKVTRKLTTANGLSLGLTLSQVISILGKPNKTTTNWTVYMLEKYRAYSKIEGEKKSRELGHFKYKGEYTYHYLVAHFTHGKLDLLKVSVGGELDW